MVEANRNLFLHLSEYCARRGAAVEMAGRTRWVSFNGRQEDRDDLIRLTFGSKLQFGRQRFLVHLLRGEKNYLGLVGFDFEHELADRLELISVGAGAAVCMLSELKPLPLAGPDAVRNVVEVSSKEEDPEYSGHDADTLIGLFPSLQLYSWFGEPDEETVWQTFLMICIDECRLGWSWIDDDLADALVALADLNIPGLPYGAICRSVFDADPRSMYMALYRCVEATYAFESSRGLVESLNVSISWHEMAAALEKSMGWRPQEASSLNTVLRHALEHDLRAVCECLGAKASDDLVSSAGKAIYSLRNAIVHFRPGGARFDFDAIDWNLLCKCLAGIVADVFSRAYGQFAAP